MNGGRRLARIVPRNLSSIAIGTYSTAKPAGSRRLNLSACGAFDLVEARLREEVLDHRVLRPRPTAPDQCPDARACAATVNIELEAVEDAMARFAKPEIFDTGQGSQLTSRECTGWLIVADLGISMDSKGAWRQRLRRAPLEIGDRRGSE